MSLDADSASHDPVRSPSLSDEADDERSPSVQSFADPAMDRGGLVPKASYPGEDTRLTSVKELWGWYSYGWAAEVFVVCGIGSFIPITLEQLAREQGVLSSDRKTPCSTGLGIEPNPGVNTTSNAARAPTRPGAAAQCVISFLGAEVNTASFAMYTFSLSVLIQALVIVSMSGAADHGRFRKSLLLGFAFVGSISTMLFLPVTSKVYFIASILAIVANISFGASFVLLNSFLPLLVRHHPTIQQIPVSVATDGRRPTDEPPTIFAEDESREHEMISSTSTLLPHDAADGPEPMTKSPSTSSPELQLSTKISSNGIGIGYVAAVIVQIISVVLVQVLGGSTFSLRVVLFFVGAWWFCFTIPSAMWLRPRPGPPLKTSDLTKKQTWLTYMGFAWLSLGRTILRARRLRDMLLFLGAWFLLSDAIATVSGTAVLFAKTTLGMAPAALALINVVVMLSGVLGAFMWSRFSRFVGLKPSGTILVCICVFELIPIYALLGYLPPLQRLGVLGLQQPWEMYPLGAVYGLVLGGLSSYCRALFGELIPPGFEASFYALYAITDKGSSIFGPAIVGAITDATGDIRPAFWFLAVLIGLPFPLMYFVNVDRGRAEGEALKKELEGHKVQH